MKKSLVVIYIPALPAVHRQPDTTIAPSFDDVTVETITPNSAAQAKNRRWTQRVKSVFHVHDRRIRLLTSRQCIQ